jgi:hypothetical protein
MQDDLGEVTSPSRPPSLRVPKLLRASSFVLVVLVGVCIHCEPLFVFPQRGYRIKPNNNQKINTSLCKNLAISNEN